MKKIKLLLCAFGLSIMTMSAITVYADSYLDYNDYYEEVNGEIVITTPNDNLATIDGVLFNKVDKSLLKYPRKNTATSYSIPDGITSIGNFAFMWCKSLTSITIPDSVTSIGIGAFSVCSSLRSITIPDSVTSIGNGAFEFCYNLRSITIPDSVTSIGEGAFVARNNYSKSYKSCICSRRWRVNKL